MDWLEIQTVGKEIELPPETVGNKLLGKDNDGNPVWEKELYRDLFEGDLWNANIHDVSSREGSNILESVIGERDISSEDRLKRLRAYEYILAYKYIQEDNHTNGWESLSHQERHRVMTAQNEVLHGLHNKIESAIDLAVEDDGDLANKVKKSRDLTSQPVGNVKVFRGLHCNAGCVFCFQEQSMEPEVQAFVADHRRLTYSEDQLTRALLYARLASSVREVNFSGGEALVNAPKSLPKEVALANELGYAQITLMSNGRLANQQVVKDLVDHGLTNLTVSIHTVDPITHFRILNWKDKGKVFDIKSFEGEDRAAVQAAINKVRADYDAEWSSPTSEIEVDPDLELKVREKIEDEIEARYEQILCNVRDAVKIGASTGLKVRFNVAYSPENMGTDLAGIIDFAENIGVSELTLISMIPGNEISRQLHTDLPSPKDLEELGFIYPDAHNNRNWNVGGIKIFKPGPSRYISIATCSFGDVDDLSFVNEDNSTGYTTFKGQSKELIFHNLPQAHGGALGTEPYSVSPDTLVMYMARP